MVSSVCDLSIAARLANFDSKDFSILVICDSTLLSLFARLWWLFGPGTVLASKDSSGSDKFSISDSSSPLGSSGSGMKEGEQGTSDLDEESSKVLAGWVRVSESVCVPDGKGRGLVLVPLLGCLPFLLGVGARGLAGRQLLFEKVTSLGKCRTMGETQALMLDNSSLSVSEDISLSEASRGRKFLARPRSHSRSLNAANIAESVVLLDPSRYVENND